MIHGDEGTHYSCQTRIKEQGGKARCCECVPHKGCDYDSRGGGAKGGFTSEYGGGREGKPTKVGKKKFNDQSPIDYIVNGGWEDHLLHSETPKKPVDCDCHCHRRCPGSARAIPMISSNVSIACLCYPMECAHCKTPDKERQYKQIDDSDYQLYLRSKENPDKPDDTGGWKDEPEFEALQETIIKGGADPRALPHYIKALLQEERKKVIAECHDYIKTCEMVERAAKEAKRFAQKNKLKKHI